MCVSVSLCVLTFVFVYSMCMCVVRGCVGYVCGVGGCVGMCGDVCLVFVCFSLYVYVCVYLSVCNIEFPDPTIDFLR